MEKRIKKEEKKKKLVAGYAYIMSKTLSRVLVPRRNDKKKKINRNGWSKTPLILIMTDHPK